MSTGTVTSSRLSIDAGAPNAEVSWQKCDRLWSQSEKNGRVLRGRLELILQRQRSNGMFQALLKGEEPAHAT